MRRLIVSVALAALLGSAPTQAASVYIQGATSQEVLDKFTTMAEKGGWRLIVKSAYGRSFSTPIS